MIDDNVLLRWSPDFHMNYSNQFKSFVLLFLIYVKRINKIYNIKIPKFLIYMIINFLI